ASCGELSHDDKQATLGHNFLTRTFHSCCSTPGCFDIEVAIQEYYHQWSVYLYQLNQLTDELPGFLQNLLSIYKGLTPHSLQCPAPLPRAACCPPSAPVSASPAVRLLPDHEEGADIASGKLTTHLDILLPQLEACCATNAADTCKLAIQKAKLTMQYSRNTELTTTMMQLESQLSQMVSGLSFVREYEQKVAFDKGIKQHNSCSAFFKKLEVAIPILVSKVEPIWRKLQQPIDSAWAAENTITMVKDLVGQAQSLCLPALASALQQLIDAVQQIVKEKAEVMCAELILMVQLFSIVCRRKLEPLRFHQKDHKSPRELEPSKSTQSSPSMRSIGELGPKSVSSAKGKDRVSHSQAIEHYPSTADLGQERSAKAEPPSYSPTPSRPLDHSRAPSLEFIRASALCAGPASEHSATLTPTINTPPVVRLHATVQGLTGGLDRLRLRTAMGRAVMNVLHMTMDSLYQAIKTHCGGEVNFHAGAGFTTLSFLLQL
ncbi:hypothetical protein CYMTET_30636, partial [Cymbomonas tetramitiformis]